MTKQTQIHRVLEYIKENGSITQYDALNELGCMRLASRISDLRRSGIAIDSSTEKVKNRFGETCYVKRYRLRESEVEVGCING